MTTPSAMPATPAVDPDSVLGVAMSLPEFDHGIPGYKRSKFGQAWKDIDRNDCDQRNDVLRRDLRDRHTKPGTNGCVLIQGVLKDDKQNYSGMAC
jgi:hypothetical protein